MGEIVCSVILTVYNNKEDVLSAIKSVIEQTYNCWELIIVDDCSNDGTSKIVVEFISSHSKYPIKYYKNAINRGTYVSKNEALKIVSGKYVATIDSDDKYNEKFLEKSVEFLEKNMNYVATISHGSKGTITGVCPAALVYRKLIIDEIGYYDSVRFGADTEFINRIRKKYGKNRIKEIKEILYIAKIRRNSLTMNRLSGFASNARKEYRENYKKWHKSSNLFMPYPLIERPFKIPKINEP